MVCLLYLLIRSNINHVLNAYIWDFNHPGVFTVFLDIKFHFDTTEGLKTDVNIKETDSRVYLHFTSYHPRQTFPSIVYSQALRYRRIIKDDTLLSQRLDELGECFRRSGYGKMLSSRLVLSTNEVEIWVI